MSAFVDAGSGRPLRLTPERLVLGGYTARDEAAVAAHIEELAREGIPAPERFPLFWRVPVDLLTTAPEISLTSASTSGEVEPVLLHGADGWQVAVGSDHTDRALEREDLAASKRACPKVVSTETWRLDDVADAWDRLVLRCEVRSWDQWTLYQEAPLAHLRPWEDLVRLAADALCPAPGAVLFLGTPPLRTDGFQFGDAYRLELVHPDDERRLTCSYRVAVAANGGATRR